jgi:hypothetical protein
VPINVVSRILVAAEMYAFFPEPPKMDRLEPSFVYERRESEDPMLPNASTLSDDPMRAPPNKLNLLPILIRDRMESVEPRVWKSITDRADPRRLQLLKLMLLPN